MASLLKGLQELRHGRDDLPNRYLHQPLGNRGLRVANSSDGACRRRNRCPNLTHSAVARPCRTAKVAPLPKDRASALQPTDTTNPDYFHRVVDCQWACPAHTDVPEYIRLIALGEFSDAYMVNRESNVFPGILGSRLRPALRAGLPTRARRRQAGGDLPPEARRRGPQGRHHVDRLPMIPRQKNGKRVACIGAGPASLTVANDLLPLGYEVVIFEQWEMPGGLMRTNIPAFRLPETVLAEEIGYIERHGRRRSATARASTACASCSRPAASTRCSSAAARRRARNSSCRVATSGAANIHIGIHWLESVAFKHLDKIGDTRADHRRRQHRDGLLPLVAASRREQRQGHGAQAAPVLQGVRLGARGRRSPRTSRSWSTTRRRRSWSRTASSSA